MKRIIRSAGLALAAAICALPTLLPNSEAALVASRNGKTVILDCSHGWRAGAQGQYGGVGFSLTCKNGKDRQFIEGSSSTAYTIRVGAESSSTGLDCFFTGDSATVDVSCASAARITIN